MKRGYACPVDPPAVCEVDPTGVKTVKYRSRRTHVVGERFWIYASKAGTTRRKPGGTQEGSVWSLDLAVPGEAMPPWMLELAEQVRLIELGALLPTGAIVGSAMIERCEPLVVNIFPSAIPGRRLESLHHNGWTTAFVVQTIESAIQGAGWKACTTMGGTPGT